MLPHMADYEDAHKALKIVSDATDHVNKLMNQGDNFKKLVELIQSFNEGNIDIHPGQILIKEGVVQEQTRDGLEQRHLILLNDQLIVGKYSHLSNNRGGWNKRGGSAKVAKLINVEVGINVEGGIFWKKLVHKCNKQGLEGGKI